MIDIEDKIAKTITNRAYRLDFETVYKLIDDKPFYLAGGSLCGDEVHDFDLYPVHNDPFDAKKIEAKITETCGKDAVVVYKSPNALTVRLLAKNQVVQFCSYRKLSLNALVDSFDFSHIQVGIAFRGNGCAPFHEHVYYTDAFVLANVTRKTEYTGSEYPLSSLMRLFKYHKRGKLNKTETAQAVMKIVKDVVDRGYEDYKDYKDQMNAVDLCYHYMAEAWELYKSFAAKGLVEHTLGDKKIRKAEEA